MLKIVVLLALVTLVVPEVVEPDWKCAHAAQKKIQSALDQRDESAVASGSKELLECMPDREGTYNLAIDTRNKKVSAEYVKFKAGSEKYAEIRYSHITLTSADCDMLDQKVEGDVVVYTGGNATLRLLNSTWMNAFRMTEELTPLTAFKADGMAHVVGTTLDMIKNIKDGEHMYLVLADPIEMVSGRVLKVRTIVRIKNDSGKYVKVFEYGYETGGCVHCGTQEVKDYLN